MRQNDVSKLFPKYPELWRMPACRYSPLTIQYRDGKSTKWARAFHSVSLQMKRSCFRLLFWFQIIYSLSDNNYCSASLFCIYHFVNCAAIKLFIWPSFCITEISETSDHHRTEFALSFKTDITTMAVVTALYYHALTRADTKWYPTTVCILKIRWKWETGSWLLVKIKPIEQQLQSKPFFLCYLAPLEGKPGYSTWFSLWGKIISPEYNTFNTF